MTVKIIAKIKFVSGPSSETMAWQVALDLLLVKLFGLIITGLPQPTPANKSNTNPNGSQWAVGFKVSLPCALGVVSPNLSAAHAWAYS